MPRLGDTCSVCRAELKIERNGEPLNLLDDEEIKNDSSVEPKMGASGLTKEELIKTILQRTNPNKLSSSSARNQGGNSSSICMNNEDFVLGDEEKSILGHDENSSPHKTFKSSTNKQAKSPPIPPVRQQDDDDYDNEMEDAGGF
jgi:hypothetical protein